jgi:hypothetical protein
MRSDGTVDYEIKNIIQSGLRNWKNNYKNNFKRISAFVRPVMLYATETLSIKKKEERNKK